MWSTSWAWRQVPDVTGYGVHAPDAYALVVGTSLFQILFTCIEVTFLQTYTNHNADFILAVLLLLGSTVGAQVDAVFGRKLKGEQLKILLAIIVLVVMVKFIFELTLTSSLLIS